MSKTAAARQAREVSHEGGSPEQHRDTHPHGSHVQEGHSAHGNGAPVYGEAAIKAAFAELGASGTGAKSATPDAGKPPPKTVSQVLGEITWLLTQSPRHKTAQLGDLEWLVMPAILLKQFRIFYKGEQPVGVVFWALADDIVSKRIESGDKRLAAAEWKCGTHMSIVDVVAPFGGEAEMREQVGSDFSQQQKISQ